MIEPPPAPFVCARPVSMCGPAWRAPMKNPAARLRTATITRRSLPFSMRVRIMPPLMSRLIVAEFLTLDGVMEAPGFEEHRDGKNAWALRFQTTETQDYFRELLAGVGAFLLGRTTYQIW